MRKLLPYEHQLIDALGVTKEEYLNFVAIQQDYKDPKIGTALDVRNGPDPVSTAALVLTIVGTLFQVGAALLAPKPEVPDGGRRQNRQQRFAPSFGFNSTQELASYGDPVNLVYTNENPNGNVRVAGSLVWSAIDNFGSTQFMRLVLSLGASNIKEIDYTKTAFGQLAFSDLNKENIYIFKGVGEPPLFENNVSGFGNKDLYPRLLKPSADKGFPAFMLLHYGFNTAVSHRYGYSQAYTPSSFTSLGVYDAIPINVDVQSRDKKGKGESANIAIEMRNIAHNSVWRSAPDGGAFFSKDHEIVLFFNNIGDGGGDKQPQESAEELRRQLAETLDFGSTYMLGAAKFRLKSYDSSSRIVTKSNEVKARFICIEGGQVPSTKYDTKRPINYSEDELDKFEKEFQEAVDKLDGNEDVADAVVVPVVSIDFTGTVKAQWRPKYKSEVSLDFNTKNGQEDVNLATLLDTVTEYLPKAGSIAYTNDLIGQISSGQVDDDEEEDLVIKTKTLRRKAKKQKKALKQLADDIKAGIFDGGEAGETIPNITFQYIDSLDKYNGFRNPSPIDLNVPPGQTFPKHQSNVTCFGLSQSDFNRFFGTVTTVLHQDVKTGSTREPYVYTFRYRASDGRLHFFNFTGIQDDRTDEIFSLDDKLSTRRDRLEKAIANTQKNKNAVAKLDKETTKIKKSALVDDKKEQGVLNKGSGTQNPVYDDFADPQKKEDKRREKVAERIEKLISQRRAEAITIIEGDIELIDRFLDELPADEQIPDRVGKKECRKVLKELRTSKQTARDTLDAYLSDWPDLFIETLDNNFFTKCLVKSESAAYTTLSACNAVTFSLKSRLSRRISGRQKKYADRKVEQYSNSDNGVKSRMAFFRVFYRQAGSDFENEVPHIFVVRHGSDADFYTQFTFYCERQEKWQFRLEPCYDMHAEIRNNSFYKYFFLENTDTAVIKSVAGETFKIAFQGRIVNRNEARKYYPDEEERGPYLTNEWDMFSVNSDTQVQFSFESGPEITLTAVTEQQLDSNYANKYKDMQMMSLGIFAGRGIQDLRKVTTLVTEGKKCRTVESIGGSSELVNSSSYAPDIFTDTLLDQDNGIGNYIKDAHLDKDSLILAKNFCKNNNLPGQDESGKIDLFMDGLIGDVGSWREFWVNNAPFSLLELARKNGKDTLVPALPVNGDGLAANKSGRPVVVTISALFTVGNILEGSYKEEFLNYGSSTEDLIASVIYRQYENVALFGQNRSVEVKLKGASTSAVRETFDASQFVTQREQAILFGKLLCNQRRWVKKGIEFRTLPSEAGLEPGQFIYVDVGLKEWDKYSSGVVMKDGYLNAPLMHGQDVGTANLNFLLHKPLDGSVKSLSNVSVVTVIDPVTLNKESRASSLSSYKGWMFVTGKPKPSKRVFRVTELAIEEGGELSVKAIEYPCFLEDGQIRARIADFRSSNFEVS